MTDYNLKQGITRFKGLYKIAGFRYWRHNQEFDEPPEHPNLDYRAFFELFGNSVLEPEEQEIPDES